MSMKQRVHWLVMHGVIRAAAGAAARRGDPQARMAFDPTVRTDPVSFFEEMRPRGPMLPTRLGYLTLDHAVAHELLRSDDFRVIILGGNLPKPLRWLERRTRDDLLHPLRPPSLLAVEPPEHTRYRKTVSSVFTSRAVAALRDRVEETAADLLEGLSGGPGVVDVVERYCSQLPVAIIGDILGVPDADRPRMLEFGELAAPILDVGLTWSQYQRVQTGLAGFNQWLSAHLRSLREQPGDDLMSQLIAASDDGRHLDETELQGVAGLVLAAGFETTVNLLGNGIRLLLSSPDQLARLRDDPSLWPNAVEEILRLESPVQLSARIALRDTEVAGASVRAGEMVAIYLAAANRDPAVFDDPHRFDVRRPNAKDNLSFGGGGHFCVGAALARLEGAIALRLLFERFPDLAAAGTPTRRPTRLINGLAALPVTTR
jgi:cytochrome P450